MEKILKTLLGYLLLIITLLFPLFFSTLTQDFFLTNKLYFLAFGALFLFLLSSLQYLVSKKLRWQSLPLDTSLFLFLLTIGLSILISSPNKIQALINPHFGLVAIFSLIILYYYLSRAPFFNLYQFLLIPSTILSAITIFFFFSPFKNATLPPSWQFLKNPTFTPLGNQLDLAIFLGFFVIFGISRLLMGINTGKKTFLIHFPLLMVNLIAFSLTLYSLFQPTATNLNNLQQPPANLLPPFRLSWYAAVEILKNPLTAAFGVGVDNFSSLFTRVKDLAYNQSPLWQINSFALSRSAILHILTETGIFGLLAFTLLLFTIAKSLFISPNNLINDREKKVIKILFIYLVFILAFFPPSLVVFFLFFLFLATFSLSHQPAYDLPGRMEAVTTSQKSQIFDTSSFPIIYLSILIISFLFITGAGYLLGRSYAAEYFFKKSLDGFAKNNAKEVYDNMRQAIILNPYMEKYRLGFSQVNLMIANNIASRAGQPQGKDQEVYELTEQDRQNISQAIQAAINEAKAAVTLNPQKAANWENLAVIYRNIVNVAQGADVWTISAYQRAIVTDPQNPIYRLNLGGFYYSLGNYEEAVRLFEQTVALKPDWPNAYYNLAWADYQRQNYQRAVSGMQNVLSLLNPQKDKADYERAQKDLEEFKKKLPKEEASSTPSATPSQLTLPTPPAATFEPKIKLPNEAAPEAK